MPSRSLFDVMTPPPTSCPVCRSPLAENAKLCGRCAAPTDGEGTTGSYGDTVLSHSALAIAIVIAVILAAIAGPGMARAAAHSRKQGEAAEVLSEIRGRQEMYRARHGRYAARLEDLSTVGWRGADAKYFRFLVSRATETEMCADAVPTAAGRDAKVLPVSVDQAGEGYYGLQCGREPATIHVPLS